MKTSLALTTTVIITLALNFQITAFAAGAAAGAATSRSAAPVAPANSIGDNSSGRILMTPQQQQQLQSAITASGILSSNPASNLSSNQLGAVTNDYSHTNNFAVGSNVMSGADNPAAANFALRDQATTISDRNLLVSLRQGLAAQLGANSSQTPIHFLVNNGTVTIVGTVPNVNESQRIFARVQQTPGVLSAFNDLHTGAASTISQPTPVITGAGSSATITDHAFSPQDRVLLSQVQQEAGMQLGINSTSASQMPVHFSIENGIVGVTGQVSSQQEKQNLLAALQRTPGVNRVVDNMMIVPGADNATPSTGPLNPEIQNGILPATSRDLAHTNNFMLPSNNSSGF